MKNITFSADEEKIERARERAAEEETTLNEKFREWLDSYALRRPTGEEFDEIMEQLSYVRTGRKFTREEMNERR